MRVGALDCLPVTTLPGGRWKTLVRGVRLWSAPQAVEESAASISSLGQILRNRKGSDVSLPRSRSCRTATVGQKYVYFTRPHVAPGGLPVEECEWAPLEELHDLLVAEQQVANRFPPDVPGVS